MNEAILIIVGSMLGTGIITGSLIVGDTLDRSILRPVGPDRGGRRRRLGGADPAALEDRGDHPSDEAAWQHVLTDPSPVIADEFLLNNGGPTSETPEVGDTITVVDPTSGATRSLTIAALSTDDYLTRRAPTEDRSSAPDEVAFDPGDRRSNAGSWGHERTAVA